MSLSARHKRASSRQALQQSVIPKPIQETATSVEWTKTADLTCSRLVTSTAPIFARKEQCTGVAAEGHGLLMSADSAFIFPYSSGHAVPPILTFPMPEGETALLGALVPGPGQEPGLLVIMPTQGLIGFWPALHSALAPSSGIEVRLSLSSGESVAHLCNAGAAGLVLATSSGRLVHISLRDAAGKPVVNLTPMSTGSGWLGAIRNATTRREVVSIKAGVAKSREEREVHVMTRQGGLTIWEVARGGNYRNLLDADLSACLAAENMQEALDVASYPSEANAVLVLIRTRQGTTKLITVQIDGRGQPSILRTVELPSLPGASLHLPNPGHVAFVQTSTNVHLVHLADGTTDCVQFKRGVLIAGVGTEDQLKNRRQAALILLTKGAGVLRLEVSSNTTDSDAIKSRLEQSVFFGSREDNPINFEPSPNDSDDAAIALSCEILTGSSSLLTRHINLQEALTDRLAAARYLAQYIKSKARPLTTQILRQDAERLAAGEELWRITNARIESSKLTSELLPASAKQASDPLRKFFLEGLQDVLQVALNAHIYAVERAAVLDPSPLSAVIQECNEIVLAVLQTAVGYRDLYKALYDQDGQKWTSTSEVLHAVTVQFDITAALIISMKGGKSEPLCSQLAAFAQLNCRLYEDALVFEPTRQAQYHSLRSGWLKHLVACGKTDRALAIGESVKDYGSLIEICHEQGEQTSDEEVIDTVVRRLEWYLHTFGYDFAAVLWEYYIQHRQYWNLLHEFPNYRQYLTQFFEDGRYPNVAWMNEIILGNYEKAGLTLLRVQEPKVEKRQIQLSIAKLSLLVRGGVPAELTGQLLTAKILRKRVHEAATASRDAIDKTAAVDLAAVTLLEGTPHALSDLLRRFLARLVRGLELDTRSAVEYLTLVKTASHFQALQILNAAEKLPPAQHEFLEKLIWRRCYIANDWQALHRQVKDKSDDSVEALARDTALYKLLRDVVGVAGQRTGDSW
ncbi:Non-repetitive/WGA-negative nucleoporin C-terminal-domain-containing protein [Protomyces lactucae-debilis]|uniref:Non-repetitive/WGA-negative nucleoporin C-terminal-domain-containing protein n=1 Tax=Protomyces lactucae-debilis TaxID=2754530 RepID=A0A1Y2F5D8_PROLT|nr:Non-repetitive/WGA-negative nucleoporin C-terminal-domain-containing protein [Protomyces lactucae-debilis]ORY79102.1 Non-repetitive/WGA-negative nucleoporin C-terminal-domain-containing protein [Protomyces lactucae-debilis]